MGLGANGGAGRVPHTWGLCLEEYIGECPRLCRCVFACVCKCVGGCWGCILGLPKAVCLCMCMCVGQELPGQSSDYAQACPAPWCPPAMTWLGLAP